MKCLDLLTIRLSLAGNEGCVCRGGGWGGRRAAGKESGAFTRVSRLLVMLSPHDCWPYLEEIKG